MGMMITPDFFVALFASDGNHGSCLEFDNGRYKDRTCGIFGVNEALYR